MYYKSVNRGISFTKAGVYLISLIFLIGILAITSNVNGLYLFLSLGLSILIISGLLSEKTMKSLRVIKIHELTVNAYENFDLIFTIENTSSSQPQYGVNVNFFVDKPKIKTLKGLSTNQPGKIIFKIAASSKEKYFFQKEGLPRGIHNQLYCYQSTCFPFSLLEKYKFSKHNSQLTVVPTLDKKLLKELNKSISLKIQSAQTDRQFYSHRSYVVGDSIKNLNWKKNANKPMNQWVIKEYRSEQNLLSFSVLFSRDYAISLDSEYKYETYLSRIRTCFELAKHKEVEIFLRIDSLGHLEEIDQVFNFLATLPKYKNRKELKDITGTYTDNKITDTLAVEIDSWDWETNRSEAI